MAASSTQVWHCFLLFVLFLLVRGETGEVEGGGGGGDDDDDDVLPMSFLDACTEGRVEHIRTELKVHPSWTNGRSPQGETCLHLAGILGQPEVTRTVLEAGGDPNVRTTFERGQRMHPLSWNVYAGHVETARVLLENGADVNLDVDLVKGGSDVSIATPLDIINDILPPGADAGGGDHPEARKFHEMKELLLSFGAKTYSELQNEIEL